MLTVSAFLDSFSETVSQPATSESKKKISALFDNLNSPLLYEPDSSAVLTTSPKINPPVAQLLLALEINQTQASNIIAHPQILDLCLSFFSAESKIWDSILILVINVNHTDVINKLLKKNVLVKPEHIALAIDKGQFVVALKLKASGNPQTPFEITKNTTPTSYKIDNESLLKYLRGVYRREPTYEVYSKTKAGEYNGSFFGQIVLIVQYIQKFTKSQFATLNHSKFDKLIERIHSDGFIKEKDVQRSARIKKNLELIFHLLLNNSVLPTLKFDALVDLIAQIDQCTIGFVTSLELITASLMEPPVTAGNILDEYKLSLVTSFTATHMKDNNLPSTQWPHVFHNFMSHLTKKSNYSIKNSHISANKDELATPENTKINAETYQNLDNYFTQNNSLKDYVTVFVTKLFEFAMEQIKSQTKITYENMHDILINNVCRTEYLSVLFLNPIFNPESLSTLFIPQQSPLQSEQDSEEEAEVFYKVDTLGLYAAVLLYLCKNEIIKGTVRIQEYYEKEFTQINFWPQQEGGSYFTVTYFSQSLILDLDNLSRDNLKHFITHIPAFWEKNWEQMLLNKPSSPLITEALIDFILTSKLSYKHLLDYTLNYNNPKLVEIFSSLETKNKPLFAELSATNPSSFLDFIKFAYEAEQQPNLYLSLLKNLKEYSAELSNASLMEPHLYKGLISFAVEKNVTELLTVLYYAEYLRENPSILSENTQQQPKLLQQMFQLALSEADEKLFNSLNKISPGKVSELINRFSDKPLSRFIDTLNRNMPAFSILKGLVTAKKGEIFFLISRVAEQLPLLYVQLIAKAVEHNDPDFLKQLLTLNISEDVLGLDILISHAPLEYINLVSNLCVTGKTRLLNTLFNISASKDTPPLFYKFLASRVKAPNTIASETILSYLAEKDGEKYFSLIEKALAENNLPVLSALVRARDAHGKALFYILVAKNPQECIKLITHLKGHQSDSSAALDNELISAFMMMADNDEKVTAIDYLATNFPIMYRNLIVLALNLDSPLLIKLATVETKYPTRRASRWEQLAIHFPREYIGLVKEVSQKKHKELLELLMDHRNIGTASRKAIADYSKLIIGVMGKNNKDYPMIALLIKYKDSLFHNIQSNKFIDLIKLAIEDQEMNLFTALATALPSVLSTENTVLSGVLFRSPKACIELINFALEVKSDVLLTLLIEIKYSKQDSSSLLFNALYQHPEDYLKLLDRTQSEKPELYQTLLVAQNSNGDDLLCNFARHATDKYLEKMDLALIQMDKKTYFALRDAKHSDGTTALSPILNHQPSYFLSLLEDALEHNDETFLNQFTTDSDALLKTYIEIEQGQNNYVQLVGLALRFDNKPLFNLLLSENNPNGPNFLKWIINHQPRQYIMLLSWSLNTEQTQLFNQLVTVKNAQGNFLFNLIAEHDVDLYLGIIDRAISESNTKLLVNLLDSTQASNDYLHQIDRLLVESNPLLTAILESIKPFYSSAMFAVTNKRPNAYVELIQKALDLDIPKFLTKLITLKRADKTDGLYLLATADMKQFLFLLDLAFEKEHKELQRALLNAAHSNNIHALHRVAEKEIVYFVNLIKKALIDQNLELLKSLIYARDYDNTTGLDVVIRNKDVHLQLEETVSSMPPSEVSTYLLNAFRITINSKGTYIK